MERLVKAVTDAGVAITGAAFGAFLYRDWIRRRDALRLGSSPEAFVDFPLSQDAECLRIAVPRRAVSRSDDLARGSALWPEPRRSSRCRPASLPARSYLAAPVRSRAGELLGGLFFGHPDPGSSTSVTSA